MVLRNALKYIYVAKIQIVFSTLTKLLVNYFFDNSYKLCFRESIVWHFLLVISRTKCDVGIFDSHNFRKIGKTGRWMQECTRYDQIGALRLFSTFSCILFPLYTFCARKSIVCDIMLQPWHARALEMQNCVQKREFIWWYIFAFHSRL